MSPLPIPTQYSVLEWQVVVGPPPMPQVKITSTSPPQLSDAPMAKIAINSAQEMTR
jgi:hypothetical protein